MHIELDRDDFTFSTLSGPMGSHRALLVRIAGKQFFTTRSVETYMEQMDPRYAEYVDKALIESMARILTKILEKACLEAPEGVELINPEEDRILTAKVQGMLYPWNLKPSSTENGE